MRKIIILLLFITVLTSNNINAQQVGYGSIKGAIIDVDTREPLPGANIIIVGTTMGMMSDLLGNFKLSKIPVGNYSLKATIMGYKSEAKEIKIENQGTTTINFTLKETVLEMPLLVVTAGKKAQSFQDVPNSVSLVTSKEIERRNRTYLDEVLEYTPGVTMVEGDVNIRGSSGFSLGAGSRVLLLVDGIPMMPGDSGDIKWDIIPLSQIDRVEVIKGAGSALYGSHALGGVINIITKEPTTIPLTEVKLSSGVYDKPYFSEFEWTDRLRHFNQLDLTHSRKFQNVGFFVSGGRRQSTGYQQNGRYLNWNLLGRADVKFNSHSQLILQSNWATSEYGEVLMWRNQNDVFEMPVTSVGDWTTSTKFSFNSVYRKLVNQKFVYKIRASYFKNFFKHHYHDNDDFSKAQKLGFEIQGDYIPSKTHSLTFGVEGIYDITDSEMFGNRDGHTWAAYFQDEIHLGELITTTLGLRYDYHYVSVDTLFSGPRYDYFSTFITDTLIVDNQFNPKLGFTIKPSLFTTIRASVGRGFRSPTLAEMFTSTNTSGFRIIPNPRLEAEKAWSYEIGINQILSKNILVDIAAFHNDYQNFIEPERDEQNTVMFVNVPRARIRGIEMTAQSAWWKKRFNTSISYTYLDPKYISRDNTFWWWLEELTGATKPGMSFSDPLAYRPKNLFTCSVSFGYGNFEAGIDYRYISRLDSVKVYPTEDRVPQKVLDSRISYNYGNITITANLNNMLNYQYAQIERNMMPMRHYVLTVTGRF
ncbi:TonB-dependent receptor [candidate division KSB1 bacterium]|nr:TonB-dependent receptor [candidate division KSB1 bacterium]